MAEEIKTGKLPTPEEWNAIPEHKRGPGGEVDEKSDVQGHGPWVIVRCWNCGCPNRVDLAWDGFWCRRCGAWNSKW